MATTNQIEAVCDLSPLQQGMLFHALQNSQEDVYVRQAAYDIIGPFDPSLFRLAWDRVVERHPALRTAISVGEKPSQVVFHSVKTPIRQLELIHKDAEAFETAFAKWFIEDRRAGIALHRAPLMRLTLMRVHDRHHRMVWTWHHIVLDASSHILVLKELRAFYAALSQGTTCDLPKATPYGDYVRWVARQGLDSTEQFWRERLRGLATPTALPFSTRPSTGDYGRGTRAHAATRASEGVSHMLREACASLGVTAFTAVLGAWAVVLADHSGDDDVMCGTTMGGRPADLSAADTIVGLCMNTVPIRVRVDRRVGVGEWLRQLQREIAAIAHYAWTPLVSIQGWSEIPRPSQLFHTLLVFENVPLDTFESRYGSHDLRDIRYVQLGQSADVHYPLGLIVNFRETLTIDVSFDSALVSPAAVSRIASQFLGVIETIARDPAAPLDKAPRLTEADIADIAAWNATATDVPTEPIHAMIESVARDQSEAVAVVFEQEHVTYGELLHRSDLLAAQVAALGGAAEAPVGICLERSPELLIATLAALRAGAPYVPLDPNYPEARLHYMVEDAGIAVVITRDAHQHRFIERDAVAVLCVDGVGSHARLERPSRAAEEGALAYVLYTSGSTGRPKGAAITHRAVSNLACAVADAVFLDATTSTLQFSSWGFDVSVAEWAATLVRGGRLVMAPSHRLLPGSALCDLLQEEEIQVAMLTPTVLARLPHDACPALRTVISAGEPCRGAWVSKWASRHVLLNGYGPTEATVLATVSAPVAGSEPNIGRALPNVTLYVVDADRHLVPPGVPGELLIGGIGVGREYVRRPALTADRFVPDGFSGAAGQRLYRTGDIVRWTVDGEIEYIDRRDAQVKLRGMRVELGEVEAALVAQPGVDEAVAFLQTIADTGERQLAACIVTDHNWLELTERLRESLGTWLPQQMVPSVFIRVSALPLTTSGKVDRAAIASVQLEAPPRTSARPPRDSVEAFVLRMWEEMFGRSDLGVDDDFFLVGGHSLHAIAFSERLGKAYRRRFGSDLVFRHRSVRSIAAMLRSEGRPTLPSTIVPLQTRGKRPPWFCVHPASGLVHCYLALSRRMGADQPFYGIQTAGLTAEQPHRSIEAMASRYVDDMLDHQKDGPFFVAGWSLGAGVAFEIGRQLQARGKDVGLIVCLDGALRGQGESPDVAAHDAWRNARQGALTFLATKELQIPEADFARVPDHLKAEHYLAHAQKCGKVPVDVNLASFERLLDVIACNMVAINTYQPQAFTGAVSLIRAEPHNAEDLYDIKRFVDGSFVVRDIVGDHTTMMNEPYVAGVAAALRSFMDDVLSAPTGKAFHTKTYITC